MTDALHLTVHPNNHACFAVSARNTNKITDCYSIAI